MSKSLYQRFSQFAKQRWKWCERHKSSDHYKKVRWRNLALVAVIISNLFLSLNFNVPATHATDCQDVEFIFARGSGDPVVSEETPMGGPSFQEWKYWIEDALYESRLHISFYDLGQEATDGHQYPAVPVSESFDGFINLIGAALSAGDGFAFGESVDEGVAELKAYIEKRSQSCPEQKFVLGGYSQGAMVISRSLSQLNPEKIIYAATFGDPKLYLPEGNSHKGIFSKIPDACKGLNFSNYRVYVPDCYAYEGILGSYRPYQPDGYIDKLGTWCNGNDIMCSSGWNISDHIDYINGHFYEQASRVIRDRIEATFAGPNIVEPPTPTEPSSNHDVIFLFDASGSMKALADIYKSQAKELIQKVINAGGRTALYAYRELEGHIWPNLRCAFGCSSDEMERAINRINFWGGGDDDEGLLSAMKIAMNESDWADGATKSIVVLTDAGFHNPDCDGSSLIDIVQQALAIDPVNVYVISRDKEEEYSELVRLTNGKYYDIDSEEEVKLSTKQIFERPVARLNQASFYGVVGDTFEFDAGASHSKYGEDLTFEWDLEGNGEFTSINNLSKVSKTFNSEFDKFIQVKVTDSHGSNTMSARVMISRVPEELAQITNLQVQTSDKVSDIQLLGNESQEISFNTDGAKVLLAVEDMPFGFITPEDGAGNFSLSDVVKPTRITLIPFSKSGHRGEKTEITLRPGSSPVVPPSQEGPGSEEGTKPTPEKPADKIVISGSASQPGTSELLPPPTTIVPNRKSETMLVPTTPNTGSCEQSIYVHGVS